MVLAHVLTLMSLYNKLKKKIFKYRLISNNIHTKRYIFLVPGQYNFKHFIWMILTPLTSSIHFNNVVYLYRNLITQIFARQTGCQKNKTCFAKHLTLDNHWWPTRIRICLFLQIWFFFQNWFINPFLGSWNIEPKLSIFLWDTLYFSHALKTTLSIIVCNRTMNHQASQNSTQSIKCLNIYHSITFLLLL